MAIEHQNASSIPPQTDQELKEDHEEGSETKIIRTEQQDEAEYPSGARLIFVLSAAALSVFLVALDTTIVSTAIPQITDEFKSVNDIGW